MKQTGGCLCGGVRYEVEPLATDVADTCHCGQCRRASGAVALPWIQVAPERFRVVNGWPKPHASSSHATRWFCPACGSPLYMTDAGGRSVGVTIGTLDDPDAVRPTVHGWTGAAVSWAPIDHALPRFAEAPPYDL